jgi:bifunctional non-homologous end joining protein LigD
VSGHPRPARTRPFQSLPVSLAPMLAVSGSMPRDERDWAFEFKWDGVRALCFWDGRCLRLAARAGTDITARYPELTGLAKALGPKQALLDGEIVAMDERGFPSFHRLQRRMHVQHGHALPRLMRSTPVTYMVFDLLHHHGRSLLAEPYAVRRATLEGLELRDDRWQTPPVVVGASRAVWAVAQKHRMEGLVAKRMAAPYRPGVRSPDWTKVKLWSQQEFVLAGWLPGEGVRGGSIGALLLGYYDRQGKLRYAGSVGTGMDGDDLDLLGRELGRRRIDASPLADPVPRGAGAVFARPELVAEVRFAEWTPDGRLRHPSYKGLRADKPARQVVREPSAGGAP